MRIDGTTHRSAPRAVSRVQQPPPETDGSDECVTVGVVEVSPDNAQRSPGDLLIEGRWNLAQREHPAVDAVGPDTEEGVFTVRVRQHGIGPCPPLKYGAWAVLAGQRGTVAMDQENERAVIRSRSQRRATVLSTVESAASQRRDSGGAHGNEDLPQGRGATAAAPARPTLGTWRAPCSL